MRWAALGMLLLMPSAFFAQQETELASGAVLRALDKLNGEVVDLSLANREIADFGPLTIRLTECRYPSGNRSGDAFAGLEITDRTRSELLFQGWMIASAPALSAMDHPRYDIWVLRCASS